MRNAFLTSLCFFFLLAILLPVYALASESDLERVAKILSAQRSPLAAARVYQPDDSDLRKRSPKGPRLYKQTVSGTVLVSTESTVGSGVRVAKGLILTNFHVVQGNEDAAILFWRPDLTDIPAVVALKPKDWVYAIVLDGDPIRDLALLAVDPKEIPAHSTIIKFSRLSDVSIGQDVFAIGHPEGLFWSYTEGVVSQIRPNYAWKIKGVKHQATIIQTQTPISFGSSGGPLFDQQGRLVGLNTWFRAAGLYFAVAVNEVTSFVFETISRHKKK